MKVLNKDELQMAERVLLKHLPKSFKVYRFLYGINRNKPSTLEVVVDTWPDFKVIICRPDPKKERALEFMKKDLTFPMHPCSNKCLLTGVNNRGYTLVHLLYLPDSSYLLTPAVDSELESRIPSLNLTHVALVNKTWRFGGNEQGYSNNKNLISNFPSFCITDDQGQPVSWILVYDYCAMCILYTLPQHRGKGYAKVLVSTMAKRLHVEGFPVYCFIEEENVVSYRLLKTWASLRIPHTGRHGLSSTFDFVTIVISNNSLNV